MSNKPKALTKSRRIRRGVKAAGLTVGVYRAPKRNK